MRLELQFIGFSRIFEQQGSSQLKGSFAARNLAELVKELAEQHGEAYQKELLDPAGHGLDPVVQVRVNGSFVGAEDLPALGLQEGDRVEFLKLISGG